MDWKNGRSRFLLRPASSNVKFRWEKCYLDVALGQYSDRGIGGITPPAGGGFDGGRLSLQRAPAARGAALRAAVRDSKTELRRPSNWNCVVKAMLRLLRGFPLCSARPRRATPSALRTAITGDSGGLGLQAQPARIPPRRARRRPALSAKNKKGPGGALFVFGGEGGIRTHGTVTRTPDFESGTFDHSATSPCRGHFA